MLPPIHPAVERRVRWLLRLLVIWGVAALARLFYIQIVKHDFYADLAEQQQTKLVEILAHRGTIYDRNGHPLAMSIAVKSAFAVPAEIADESLAAHLLSGIVNVPEEALQARFESSRSFAWVSRKLPPEKVEAVQALDLKGI